MKYILFNDEYETREEAEEALYEYATESYDDYLDEEGTVNVAGLEMYPSIILKRCDEIAYRCGLDDYYDVLLDNIEEVEDEEED